MQASHLARQSPNQSPPRCNARQAATAACKLLHTCTTLKAFATRLVYAAITLEVPDALGCRTLRTHITWTCRLPLPVLRKITRRELIILRAVLEGHSVENGDLTRCFPCALRLRMIEISNPMSLYQQFCI